ncbi:VanZ family protein [Planctomonas sp. JC2975]|uniref:VanZ family protein n=1 Tax=Planctomonas sp. JC2975 TaxID=2729626 RepID=UPI0014743A10|nr:VanZ family protein [Planctomonas sp. JC2975]NNC13339.1 VanZ family protein [Planctomonas sp. JC2975]
MFRRHPFLSVVTLLYLAGVAWITLGPQPDFGNKNSLVMQVLRILWEHPATDWVTYAGVEFTANIAMFLPIGLFFLLLFGRRQWWLAVLIPFLMTLGIETAQIWIPGRVSDIRDVISNTIGAIVGVFLGLALTAPRARRDREAARAQARQRVRA